MLGLVARWPRGEGPNLGLPNYRYVDATVTAVDAGMCFEPELDAEAPCRIFDVHLTSGPDRGDDVTFPVRPTQFEVPPIDEGNRVALLDRPDISGQYRYAFSDFQRSTPLLWLFAGFVVVVIAFGRWQGLRALVGLAASGLVLLAFVVPALVRDESTLLVALSGTITIAFLALYLAHGVNRATTVALAGTLVSLVITTVIALVAVEVVRMLVGSIGLVLSVPITTALAAVVLTAGGGRRHDRTTEEPTAPVPESHRHDPWDDFTPNEWRW